MVKPSIAAACAAACLLMWPLPAGSQVPGPDLPPAYDGPAVPVAPAVMNRDSEGRATLRAVRLAAPLKIDGVLDEPLYRDVPPISDFIQMEPDTGAPATERTEAWVAFDDDNVYVSFKAWDSRMDSLVATEMRRDSTSSWMGNDIVSFIFDTFYDRRNSITFTINPLGGRSDGQLINERQYSSDWNPVWSLETGRFEGGWSIEAALPFKSLRYGAGRSQIWGFNAMRVKRSLQEISTITRVPPARGQQGFQQPSFAATLVGIEAPPGGRSLDLKPYLTSSLTTEDAATPRLSNQRDADIGFDARIGITQNLTADVTYNTDFAQVEVDEQQVNLTRFPVFFPEKREFFLENQSTFAFGGVPVNGGGDAPVLFYSRRIGLNRGRTVPLEVGGRLSGRMGRYSIGALNIQTDDVVQTNTPRTNFSVVRLKRDVFERSSVGVLFTNRSVSASGVGSNQVYGVDGTFAFLENLQINTYWARSESDGAPVLSSSNDPRPPYDPVTASYRAQVDYAGDRYGVQAERLAIGDAFRPEVGFVRRGDMVRDFAQFRFSPRPRDSRVVRKYSYQASLEYIEDAAGQLESRERSAEFAIEFQSTDRLSLGYSQALERLPEPFGIGGVILPVDTYRFDTWRLQYNIGQQRGVSANLTAEYGTFYNGRKTTLSAARGRIPLTAQLSIEPVYTVNRVTLDEGAFTQHLGGARATFTLTPLMFVSALVQYNSEIDAVSTNARFRWEYQPGSELFVVYNEERNTTARSFPSLMTRALVVKVNRLFRF